MHVAQLGAVLKLETSGASHRHIVVAWTDVSDLERKFVKILREV